MTRETPAPRPVPHFAPPPRGLCPDCRHVRAIHSERGSTFWLCERSRGEPIYPKYPPQPRVSCPGFER
jgi:hypothetical protein